MQLAVFFQDNHKNGYYSANSMAREIAQENKINERFALLVHYKRHLFDHETCDEIQSHEEHFFFKFFFSLVDQDLSLITNWFSKLCNWSEIYGFI